MTRLYIITLHRSGSTWLRNILHQNSRIEFAIDELNIFEPFRANTLDKYFKYGVNKDLLITDITNKKVFGSFFKKTDVDSLKQIVRELDRSSSVWDFLRLYSERFDVDYFGFKYPCHVRAFRKLESYDKSAKFIFLTRKLNDLHFSKINDKSPFMSHRGLIGVLFRLYVLFYNCLSYLLLIRLSHQHNPNVITVSYEDMISNPEICIKRIEEHLGLSLSLKSLRIRGKPSSHENNNRTLSKDLWLIEKKMITYTQNYADSIVNY